MQRLSSAEFEQLNERRPICVNNRPIDGAFTILLDNTFAELGDFVGWKLDDLICA